MSSTFPIVLQLTRCKICLASILLASLASFGTTTHAAEAQFNSKIPAETWKAVRLKNLPEGASLGVKVIATGSLSVILIHETQLKRAPSRMSPIFQGRLERTLSFSVVIPDSGNYYIVLDNRRGANETQVRILIQAQAPSSRITPTPPLPASRQESTHKKI